MGSIHRVRQRVSRYPSGFFFALYFSLQRTSVSCQEFTTAVYRCAPRLRGNPAEWFHVKSLSVKAPRGSPTGLRTAVNNIELLTVSVGFTFAPPFIGGRPSRYGPLFVASTQTQEVPGLLANKPHTISRHVSQSNLVDASPSHATSSKSSADET